MGGMESLPQPRAQLPPRQSTISSPHQTDVASELTVWTLEGSHRVHAVLLFVCVLAPPTPLPRTNALLW